MTKLFSVFIIIFSLSCFHGADSINKQEMIQKQKMDWEALKSATGEEYTKKRDELLKSKHEIQKLIKTYKNSSNPDDRILTRILAGWMNHSELYKQVVTDLDTIDVDFIAQTRSGLFMIYEPYTRRAQNDFKEDILPLCWESLLKYNNTMETWKINTYIYMVCAIPDEITIHVLKRFLEKTEYWTFYAVVIQRLNTHSWKGVKDWLVDLEIKSNALKIVYDSLRTKYNNLFEQMCNTKDWAYLLLEKELIMGGRPARDVLKMFSLYHNDPFAQLMAKVYISWIDGMGEEYEKAIDYLFHSADGRERTPAPFPSASGIAYYLNKHFESRVVDVLTVRLVKQIYGIWWMASGILAYIKEQNKTSPIVGLFRYVAEEDNNRMRDYAIFVIKELHDTELQDKLYQEQWFLENEGKRLSPYLKALVKKEEKEGE